MTHAVAPAPTPVIAPALPRLRPGKLCVAIRGSSPAELLDRAEAAVRNFKFIELRLDTLSKPANAPTYLKQFLAEHKDVTVIATCRRKTHGGEFDGPLTAQLEILTKAAQAGCQIIDLEVESAEEAKSAQLAKLRTCGAALLVSFHDYSRTKGLEQAADRIEAFKPDYVKVVSTARNLVDNLAVLRLIEDRSLASHVVGIAMGEEGLVSRVLGPRAGAAFTFASYSEGSETAPGQVTAETLRDVYRLDNLDQATRVFGVAGNPIMHSLSPVLHNAAFRREIVNAVMLPLKPKSVQDLLTLARELPLAGCAITMPLKTEVLPHLANMDPLTSRIGACNTLRMGADGKLYGFNTDVAGVIRPLERRLKLKGARVVVLGAGARASRGLWAGGAGRRGAGGESHARACGFAGAAGQGQVPQA